MAYTTTTLVKAYRGISASTDDTLIASLIAYAQQIIDTHCHRTFESSANADRTFDAVRDVDGLTLYLDEDLCSINSITNGDGTTVTTAKYTTEPRNRTPYFAIRLLDSANIIWEVNSTTSDSEDAITISGKWAYSTSAPNDIVHACTRLTSYLYTQKDNSGDLDRPIIAGDVTLLPAQLPRDILEILGHKPGDKYVKA